MKSLKTYIKRYTLALFLVALVLFCYNNIYSQDFFRSKYNINRESAASLAVLLYESPIFILPQSIKTFIENNKNKFIELAELSKPDDELLIETQKVYDSASASLRFKQIKSALENKNLNKYNFFLLDFLNLILYKNEFTSSLEKFFLDNAKEKIGFSFLPFEISTNEKLFFHIKDSKNGIDHYILLKSDNLNDTLFELLKFIFKERIFYTTILPKSVDLNKSEQLRYIDIFKKPFLYPEVENMLENIFILYCISNISENIYKYTGISINENLQANTYYFKSSWINELIKSWDALENKSIFKFPRPYGQIFVEMIKSEKIFSNLASFSKIIELNPDIIAIIYLPKDFLISNKQKILIQKKLQKIGFKDVVYSYEYEKNINSFKNKKLVSIYFTCKNGENISSFYIDKQNKNIQIGNTLVNSFTELASISFFDNIEILLMVNKITTDSIMKSINLIPQLKDKPIVVKRNFIQIIISKIISLINPLLL